MVTRRAPPRSSGVTRFQLYTRLKRYLHRAVSRVAPARVHHHTAMCGDGSGERAADQPQSSLVAFLAPFHEARALAPSMHSQKSAVDRRPRRRAVRDVKTRIVIAGGGLRRPLCRNVPRQNPRAQPRRRGGADQPREFPVVYAPAPRGRGGRSTSKRYCQSTPAHSSSRQRRRSRGGHHRPAARRTVSCVAGIRDVRREFGFDHRSPVIPRPGR